MWIVVWALIFFGKLEPAHAGPPPCSKYATSPEKSAEDSSNQLDPFSQVGHYRERITQIIALFSERLGVKTNPFDEAFTSEQGDYIDFELKNRELDSGARVPSPLVGVLDFVIKSTFGPWRFETDVIETTLTQAAALVNDPDAKKRDLQSDLLALKQLLRYTDRFKPNVEIHDRDGKPIVENKIKEKKPKRQSTEREHPQFPKEYKPHTKDTDNADSEISEPVVLAKTDFVADYFAARNYSEVIRSAPEPFREVDLPETFTEPSPAAETGKNMTYQTFGASAFKLMMPSGFRPRQPFDPRARIKRTGSGGYEVNLKAGSNLNEIRIPMEIDDGLVLMPQLLEHYTRPIDIRLDEWPDSIQAAILRKFKSNQGRSRRLEIAKAIQDHLSLKYLYSVDSRSETDLIEALKAGKLQCDLAAYAMLGLLRHYKIPSRIMGGVPGKKNGVIGGNESYLVLPADGHAWIEVFEGGRWHTFDPTPHQKDRETEKPEDPENPFVTRIPENTSVPQVGGSEGEDHVKEVEKTTQKRLKEVIKETPPKKPEPAKAAVKPEDLVDRLSVGSLVLDPPPGKNPLVLRAMRQVFKVSLDPTRMGTETANALAVLGGMIKYDSAYAPLKAVYNLATSAHAHDHPGLTAWLERVLSRSKTHDVNETHQELIRIQNALVAYGQVLDPGSPVSTSEVLTEVGEVLEELNKMVHPDAKDMALAESFVRNLPSVPRRILNQDYRFNSVGPNAPTRAIAKGLKNRDLADLRLVSMLTPMANFILGSTPRPEYQEFPTWMEDSERSTRNDLLPFTRWSDMNRVILAQPHKTLDQNIEDGTAWVPTRRQRVRIPTGFGREEAERLTLVLFDTSGSMNGGPARFQAAVIGAFSGLALSDVTPSGRHRHKVVLIPFDSTTGIPVVIDTAEKAIEVIRSYQSKLKNTGLSTDIQEALLKAIEIIADAQKNSRDPLAAANIILMSDGGSTVDTDTIMKARMAKISRQTPLQFMFVAINSTNPDLIRLAHESAQMGAEGGHYREFDRDRITKILAEADTVNLEDFKKAFFTEKDARDISPQVLRLLAKTIEGSKKLSDQIFKDSHFSDPDYHFDNLQQARVRDDSSVGRAERPLEEWLNGLRRFAMSPLFKNRILLAKVVDDLVKKFKNLTQLDLRTDLTGYELEHVRHLLRYAAGLEDGTGQPIGSAK